MDSCGLQRFCRADYLGCEENWAFYFQTTGAGAALPAGELAARRRYGVPAAAPAAGATRAPSQGWHAVSSTDDRFARWNLAATGANAERDFRNEANTFGFNVEIDPLAPDSTPVKRVAMGRFAHEAAVCSLPQAGQPLAFYMGCDSRNEYIYKFVTTALWDPRDVGAGLTWAPLWARPNCAASWWRRWAQRSRASQKRQTAAPCLSTFSIRASCPSRWPLAAHRKACGLATKAMAPQAGPVRPPS